MTDPLQGALVVFDLDGTLVDTAPDLLRALNHVLDLEGLPHPPVEIARRFIGHGARVMIEQALAQIGVRLDEERLAELTAICVDVYASDIAGKSRPFPGALAALDALQGAGARLAICTNKRTFLSMQLLEALGLAPRFAAIVGADSVPARKPDPDHLLRTIAEAGGDTARTVYVGDTIVDAQAGEAAGVATVIVRFGYNENPAAFARVVIDDYEELAAVARRLLASRPSR